MKKIEGIKYCQFVPNGSRDVSLIMTIIKWLFINSIKFYPWLIIVMTPVTGKGGGEHIDIYNAKNEVNGDKLIKLLKEDHKKESIILINCFSGSFYSSF